MKFSDLTYAPVLMRRETAVAYLDGECNLDALLRAGWVKPIIQRKKNTTFARDQLDAAVKRAIQEGWPA